MPAVAAAIGRLLGQLAGRASFAFMKGFARGGVNSARALATSAFNSAKAGARVRVATLVNKSNIKRYLDRLGPVLNVAGIGSLVYFVADSFLSSDSNAEQTQQLQLTARRLANSPMYLDFSKEVSLALGNLNLDTNSKVAVTQEFSSLLKSSSPELAKFSELISDLTPLQFVFASVNLFAEQTAVAVDKILADSTLVSQNGLMVLAGAVVGLLTLMGVTDESNEPVQSESIEGQLFSSSSQFDRVSGGACSIPTNSESAFYKAKQIRRLEVLTGLRGYSGARIPALAEFLSLIKEVSVEDVEYYYELRQLVE